MTNQTSPVWWATLFKGCN